MAGRSRVEVRVKEEIILFVWCACCSFQAGTFVIFACAKEYIGKAYAGEVIYTSSDGQAALQALKISGVTSKFAWEY
jgi:hypothetical protein